MRCWKGCNTLVSLYFGRFSRRGELCSAPDSSRVLWMDWDSRRANKATVIPDSMSSISRSTQLCVLYCSLSFVKRGRVSCSKLDPLLLG